MLAGMTCSMMQPEADQLDGCGEEKDGEGVESVSRFAYRCLRTKVKSSSRVIGLSSRAATAIGLTTRGAAHVPPALAAAVNTAATDAAEATSSSEMAPGGLLKRARDSRVCHAVGQADQGLGTDAWV